MLKWTFVGNESKPPCFCLKVFIWLILGKYFHYIKNAWLTIFVCQYFKDVFLPLFGLDSFWQEVFLHPYFCSFLYNLSFPPVAFKILPLLLWWDFFNLIVIFLGFFIQKIFFFILLEIHWISWIFGFKVYSFHQILEFLADII